MSAVPDLPRQARLWPPDEATLRTLFERGRLKRGAELTHQLSDIRQDAHGASARFPGPRGQVYELALQGVAGREDGGRPHYSALCTCRTARFCEHAAALMIKLQTEADAPLRAQLLHTWVEALRRKAGRAELQQLPRLPEADAAKLMDLLLGDALLPPPPAPLPQAAAPEPAGESAQFRPRLTLKTLGRGDGLLGLSPSGKLGPRSDVVTVAQVDWTYRLADGLLWTTPAQRSLLNSRPGATQQLGDGRMLARDLGAEAEARDQLWALGLLPLDPAALQWRSPAAVDGHEQLWTLLQEEFFGEFWTERVPELQKLGWAVEARPGFAHRAVAGEAWRIRIDPLSLPAREGAWLLSLGVEIEGESLDLAPMIADLLRRDARWFDAEQIAAIDDLSIILLHAPGGRRIEAPASILKPILGAMVDLLSDPKRAEGPLQLSDWDAGRLELLDQGRAGWQIHGDAGLRQMANKLRAAGSPQPVAPPEGLGLTLRGYQLAGLAWLQYLREQGLAGILADDMGLGKTAQALAHLLLEKQAGRMADRPALAVLPTSLLFNWLAEARRIAPELRVLLLHGPDRHAHFPRLADYDLVLSTYPLLWRDIEALAAQPWHLLILDEAQTVKNAGSRAAKAVRRLRARHRLALTGTPLENHLGELWAQFDFLMPGFLGDERSFFRLWRKPIEVNGESLRAQLLSARVRPFILRRRKEEVATELPPLTEVTRRVRLYGQQRDLYESVRVAADTQVRRVLQRRGFGASQITVLDALLKLRQVCCDPLLLKDVEQIKPDTERAKLELLAEMLPELLAEGRRVLVFSQFAEMLGLIAAQLKQQELDFLVLTGATPVAQRGEIVRRFQAQACPLMLISLKAGGVGLNLTAADTVIHVDPWWNPAVEAQASARAHRIGQDKPVFVYKLVVEGSIEERMLELQARKLTLAEGVLGSDGADTAKFTEQDLERLLAPLA